MPKDGCWSTQNQYFLSESSSTAICSGLVYVFHPRIPLPTQKSMPIFFSCRPPIIAPNCVHKLRCTIQKHRRCTFSMSYCTSAGSSINTADHPDWSCLQCTICIAKYFISYIRGDKYKSGLFWLNANFFAKMEPTKTYHIPNRWKFYEDFAELWKF